MLMEATRGGFDYLVAGLLQVDGIDVDAVSNNGQSAYDLAAEARNAKIMSLLACHDTNKFAAPVVPCQQVKVMCVGESFAGKTTLVKALHHAAAGGLKKHGNRFEAPRRGTALVDRSHGIESRVVVLDAAKLSPDCVAGVPAATIASPWHLRLFDTAGHGSFFASQQLFLTSHTLYLVVFNVQWALERTVEHLVLWSQAIASRCSGVASVVIVGTHAHNHGVAFDEVRLFSIAWCWQQFNPIIGGFPCFPPDS